MALAIPAPRARATGATATRAAPRTTLISAGSPDRPVTASSMPLEILRRLRRMPSPVSVAMSSPSLREEALTLALEPVMILSSSSPSSRAKGAVSACTSMKALPRAIGSSYGLCPLFLPHDRIHRGHESPLLGGEIQLLLEAFRWGFDIGHPGGTFVVVDVTHD